MLHASKPVELVGTGTDSFSEVTPRYSIVLCFYLTDIFANFNRQITGQNKDCVIKNFSCAISDFFSKKKIPGDIIPNKVNSSVKVISTK